MDKLNSDMVLEILNRLPIESVLQCRRVCAIWRNLLGKPKTGMFFINNTRIYDDGYGLDYIEQFPEMVVTKIGNVFTGVYPFNLIGSCNGLVCYSTYDPKFGVAVMYIFNPITSERIRVPNTGKYYDCAGFGYCHSSCAYKVVGRFSIGNGKHGVQVYTLGNGNRWEDKLEEISFAFTGTGVFADGALHWLIHTKISKCHIVAFDLEDETFRCFPLPLCHLTSNSSINVTREGDLCLCLRYIDQGEPMMDVWLFKKKNMNNCRRSTRLTERTYSNSFTWIKVFSGKLGSGSKCQLLSLTQSEILLWQNGVISCYDVKATAAAKLWCAEVAKGYVYATPHMNTLVSLKDLGEDLVDAKTSIRKS